MELRAEDIISYLNVALDQLTAKVDKAADAVAVVPPVPGASSVFGVVTHTLAVIDFWPSHVVCGDPTTRDRESEFVATGTAAELLADIAAVRAGLSELIARAAAIAEPAKPEYAGFMDDRPWSTASVMLHLIEETFQHVGHVDILADLVASG